MTFVANLKSTGERIRIFDYASPREQLKKEDVVCRQCGQELIIRAGLVLRPHFAHKADCAYEDYDHHPESPEHLYLKEYIARVMSLDFEAYLNATPILEYRLDEVRRIADVVFEFPNGWLIAHEIQLSGITTEQLSQRTEDYRNAGVDVIWWLGESADTPANRAWVRENFGECYLLDVDAVRSALGEDDRPHEPTRPIDGQER